MSESRVTNHAGFGVFHLLPVGWTNVSGFAFVTRELADQQLEVEVSQHELNVFEVLK